MINSEEKIVIIGAGIAGLTLAIQLKKIGVEPIVFEEHEEADLIDVQDKKSVNITISYRGIQALERIECADELRAKSMEIMGRTHFVDGESYFTPYTSKSNFCLYSIDRKDLMKILIQKAKNENVKIQFGFKLTKTRFDKKICFFLHDDKIYEYPYDFLFGVDGVHSNIRNWLRVPHIITQRDYIYKKIDIDSDNALRLKLSNSSVNIWPNPKGLFFTLPNKDGSQAGLINITSKTLDEIEINSELLKVYFSNLINIVDNFYEKFQTTPPGSFREIQCSSWFARNSVLLMGDSVHAMMPFYAQGANCALEDVSIFCKMLEENVNDLEKTSLEFQAVRPPMTKAIVKLSRGNLKNLKADKKIDEHINIKNIELGLEKKFPDYFSEYSMVTFTDIPYDRILNISQKRQSILSEYSKRISGEISDNLLSEVYSKLKLLKI